MCDSFVVLPEFTEYDSMILAKNSDRPEFDCQPLVYNSRRKNSKGETLKLAYVEIPEADITYATVGSSPYWCWGYEEGFNEFGVAIANVAIFTKDLKINIKKAKKGMHVEKGIIGMELIRLGLERGQTAKEALEIMTYLVEKYGQWGSGIPTIDHIKNPYNNSYIVCDRNEAWILETIGKNWAAKKVADRFYAISNEMSIRTNWDISNENIINDAINNGWWEEENGAFDLAFVYTDFEKPLQVSHIRVQRMNYLLKKGVKEFGKINLKWIKKILRDHYEDTFLEGPKFNAALPDFLSICMHSSPANFTWGNTASSAIFIIPKNEKHLPILWWTPLTPCTGLYIPIFIDGDAIPEILSKAGTFGKANIDPSKVQKDAYLHNSYWWIFKELLDIIKGDEFGSKFNIRQKIVREVFDNLENRWEIELRKIEKEAIELKFNGQNEKASKILADFTKTCVEEAIQTVNKVKKLILEV